MLDNYVLEYQKFIDNNPGMTETEIVMYIYLDLGKRLKFDPEFFFGGTKRKNEIYNRASSIKELNLCLERDRIICKSAAYILEYLGNKLGINIITIDEDNYMAKYNHVLNIVIPKDGSPSYQIDLQNDMTNIHYNCFTSNFGRDVYENDKYVILPMEQKKMHLKFGYLNKNNSNYMDEYIDLFKLHIDLFSNFYEKLDFVLTNIEPVGYPNVDYWERRWQHENILYTLFDNAEFERKVRVVEFFTENNNEYVYNNGFFINTKDGVTVYYYNKDNYKYDSYNINEFARKVIDENIHYRQGIMGLQKEINELKNSKVKKI